MQRFLASALLLMCPAVIFGQITDNTTNTVVRAIIPPGINVGSARPFGPQQIYRDWAYQDGGSQNAGIWRTSVQCATGGTIDPTHWYGSATSSNGYAANWWATGTFNAINSVTGVSYGAGTITASTANNAGTGLGLTLNYTSGTATTCVPANHDVIIISQQNANSLLTPLDLMTALGGGLTGTVSIDTTDLPPSSGKTDQVWDFATGATWTLQMDQKANNATNSNPTLQGQQVNWRIMNGTGYKAQFWYKCTGSDSTIHFDLERSNGASYVGSSGSPVSVACTHNNTPGAGWTQQVYTFNASEPGNTFTDNLVAHFSTSGGTVKIQLFQMLEPSINSLNTTPFTDAFFQAMTDSHAGSDRDMGPDDWGSSPTELMKTTANVRFNSSSNFSAFAAGAMTPNIPYDDRLSLYAAQNTNGWITMPNFTTPAEGAAFITWLSTNTHYLAMVSQGKSLTLEYCNECWNSGASGSLWQGNGTVYAHLVAPLFVAMRTASGFDATHMKLAANDWYASNQSFGNFGWAHIVGSYACGITNACPDRWGLAPYTLGYLQTANLSGSDVSPTGAPILDMGVEPRNIDSVTSPPANTPSMYLSQKFLTDNHYGNGAVYEYGPATQSGNAITQGQLNQIDAGVWQAIINMDHAMLMQRDTGIIGPIHLFSLTENNAGYTCTGCTGSVFFPGWGNARYMAAGPGNLSSFKNQYRPGLMAMQIVNTAIGSKTNVMSASCSGVPTISYPGGQNNGAGIAIAANASVPTLDCFTYGDGSNNFTKFYVNKNLTTAQTVTITGLPPSGSYSITTFPNSPNIVTSNCENTYIGASSIACTVTLPSATSSSGPTITVPAASLVAITYSASGTPAAATPTFSPVAGTYSSAQNVTISTTTPGASITWGTTPTPTTPYTGPVTVSSSETLYAFATAPGFSQSATGSAVYTISVGVVATPTFSPSSGTYNNAQTVTASTITTGANLFCTIDGTTPTPSSPPYTGPFSVTATQTIQCIGTKSGLTNSSVGAATYTLVAATPTFTPLPGGISPGTSITIATATSGATIHYTIDGTTPTIGSPTYSGPVLITTSPTTLKAIALQGGYTPSGIQSGTYTIQVGNWTIIGTTFNGTWVIK